MADDVFDLRQAVSAEHAPMSALDELPVHQWSEQEMRFQSTTDPRAYERYWFTAQDRTGDLFVVTGFGLYPNLRTVEAYSIVNLRGQHTTVRAHRRLTANRADMRVGPIDFRPLRAFGEWRLTLDPNDYGISYDLCWQDTKRAVLQPIRGLGGYETFGRVSGEVTVQGERFQLTPDLYCGSRDHHWGVRDGVGGRGHMLNPGGTSVATGGVWVEFGNWSVWLNRILYNLGDKRPGAGQIVAMERRLSFEPDTHIFTGGTVSITLQGGEKRDLHLRRLGFQTAYLRCGMYGGREGGTPNGDIWHGMYVGDNVVSGETYDTTDPAVRMHIAGAADHHCEVRCGDEVAYGIFESHDPITWEMARDGRPGYSLIE
jgi:hypothetical protein